MPRRKAPPAASTIELSSLWIAPVYVPKVECGEWADVPKVELGEQRVKRNEMVLTMQKFV